MKTNREQEVVFQAGGRYVKPAYSVEYVHRRDGELEKARIVGPQGGATDWRYGKEAVQVCITLCRKHGLKYQLVEVPS